MNALFRLTLKKNWLMFTVFFSVLVMYVVIIVMMYSPDDMKEMEMLVASLPAGMAEAFGFGGALNSLTGLIASWLYGLLMTAFPMTYSILLANALVAKSVDSGSMACLLATPLSRTQIAVTKAVFATTMLTLLIGLSAVICAVTAEVLFPNALDYEAFLQLNITTLLVNILVLAICFFCSCFFTDGRYAIGFGAGIPVAFMLMSMLADAGEQAKFLNHFTIFGWYDPAKLVEGTDYFAVNCAYVALSATLFTLAILIFRRKKLPL